MEYDNEKSGALFANKDKKEDWHADMQGDIKVEGVEYYLNGYKNVSKAGQPYIRVTLKAKKESAGKAATEKLSDDADFSDFGM